ncbi:hypothetical protein PO909_014805 [Leuciscus waleckii]
MTQHNIPIIILSDEDDDEGDSLMTLNDSSVLIVENERNEADISKHIEELDEDLAITYSQTAIVLPHARYDCTLAFCRAEQDVSGPLQNNAQYCDQCFCYICDKLASMCEFWTIPGFCHCNSHKHSVYWKSLRDKSLMGYLHELNFTFEPLDMDSDLRRAEASLHTFAGSLAMKYATFLLGFESLNRSGCRCICHRNNNDTTLSQAFGCKGCHKHHFKILEYDYTVVSQHIKMFFNEAKKENPKASVVMLLGAIKLFVTHTVPGNVHAATTVSETVSMLLWRFMTKVWTLLVDFDFSSTFIKQLEYFFQRLPLPSNSTLPKSLSVLPWDDPLLSGVIKGQNITGERQVKGRKLQVLYEPLSVIQARVCKLQQQNKYRELARYLKIVRSTNSPTLLRMRDLVPLYLCKVADYSGAVHTMFSPMLGAACPASRLTPPQFRAYLRIFTSGQVPDIAQQEFDPGNGQMITPDPLLSTKWTPIEDSNTFKMMEVLKFALRVLDCNAAVFANSETWVYLLGVVSSSFITPDGLVVGAFYAEPDVTFQAVTKDSANAILKELTQTSRIQIPKTFENGYPDQARLLLATQALVLRIFHSQLSPILDVIISFRFNHWALRWFFNSLLGRPDVLHYLLCCLLQELSHEEQYQLIQATWSETEHSLVASFLCLYFLENSVVLDSYTYPINSLLATWNELYCPWQLSLRLQLESNVARLTTEKRQILQQIQRQGT